MAQLNVVVRTLIRLAFGTALPPGSHQDALQSYRKATQLCPERLIHRRAHSNDQLQFTQEGIDSIFSLSFWAWLSGRMESCQAAFRRVMPTDANAVPLLRVGPS